MPDPRMTMQAHVHPKAMLIDTSERVVSVRLDLNAPTESAGAVALPLNFALVIDKSGSMSGQKIETAKAGAVRIVQRLAVGDTFSLTAFSSDPEVIVPACVLGPDRSGILARIAQLQSGDQTNLSRGMQAALEQLQPHGREGVSSAMFILTDGLAGDPAQCLQLAPEIAHAAISIYAGGIGADYDHAFLEQLCTSPHEEGKFRVDHIDMTTLDRMVTLLEGFLKRKGHVVTANCRMFVTFPRRIGLKSVQAEEHARPIQLDAQQSFPIADLYAGKQQRYMFEFVTTPSVAGNMQLARFRLLYDLAASNVRQAEAETDAMIEITEDPSRANIPNSEVMQVAKKLQATKLSEAAEADLARKDIRGATKKLERVTRTLEELGEHDQAREVKERATALEKSDPQNLDLEIKRLRGTTKRLSE